MKELYNMLFIDQRSYWKLDILLLNGSLYVTLELVHQLLRR